MPVLQGVPQAVVATDVEFLRFIAQQTHCGIGIGNVAAHLFTYWSLCDFRIGPCGGPGRLLAAAARLGLSANRGH
jgi:hypothetical protein